MNLNCLVKYCLSLVLFLSLGKISVAQNVKTDSTNNPNSITVVGNKSKSEVINLPHFVGTNIYAGKKNALIILNNITAPVANNNMRQVMAKIPGIFISESDGSGIQIGISARGLSPNRSWEFNIRQNNCEIASDPYGYPEAYYNPQLQAVQRIQVVRGAGALQYGTQFGGMINYILKDGSNIDKKVAVESNLTVGSFKLLNAFTAIGGQLKKWNYYFFYDNRTAAGWRKNSQYNTQTFYGNIGYQMNVKMKISLDNMNYTMLSQQPGGLSQVQFESNTQQSVRNRNWFSTPWKTTNLKFNYDINSNTRLQLNVYQIKGDRKSVGFLQNILVNDTINKNINAYNPREVAIDYYKNFAVELNFLHHYTMAKKIHSISAGLRYFKGNTTRLQKGIGTKLFDADFSVVNNIFPTNLNFHSKSYSAFFENSFSINNHLLIIPGMRFENIVADGKGRIGINNNGTENLMQNESRKRNIFLAGIGIEYHISNKSNAEIYANATQAYRPILFSNITSPTTDVVDPNLKDNNGYNAEIGIRKNNNTFITFDISAYFLQYNNRIATVSKLNTNNQPYHYITNIGNSTSKGVEALVEIDLIAKIKNNSSKKTWGLPIFINYTKNISNYGDYKLISVVNNIEVITNLKGKHVEYAPTNMLRTGISYVYKNIKITTQWNYCSAVYSDANNTEAASANGQIGKIPSYTIFDVTGNFVINKNVQIKFSINNIANKKYFTRRSGSYPGPGILPSDARNLLLSIATNF